MSDGPPSDPYATAKANLRDTIKWLATSLSALGAVVIAGASINGLASLQGPALFWAALFGAFGLFAILINISIMVRLLTANVFYFSSLSLSGDPIASEINAHAKDILSPQTPTVHDLVVFRQAAVTNMQAAAPGDSAYQRAFMSWTAANDAIARVSNLAQFLSLRREFEKKQPWLFGLTVFIIATLGGYALLCGGKSTANLDLMQKVTFRPGAGWADAASSLADTCGADPLKGVTLLRKSFEGWITVRLTGPGKCSGLELTVPASLVHLVGP